MKQRGNILINILLIVVVSLAPFNDIFSANKKPFSKRSSLAKKGGTKKRSKKNKKKQKSNKGNSVNKKRPNSSGKKKLKTKKRVPKQRQQSTRSKKNGQSKKKKSNKSQEKDEEESEEVDIEDTKADSIKAPMPQAIPIPEVAEEETPVPQAPQVVPTLEALPIVDSQKIKEDVGVKSDETIEEAKIDHEEVAEPLPLSERNVIQSSEKSEEKSSPLPLPSINENFQKLNNFFNEQALFFISNPEVGINYFGDRLLVFIPTLKKFSSAIYQENDETIDLDQRSRIILMLQQYEHELEYFLARSIDSVNQLSSKMTGKNPFKEIKYDVPQRGPQALENLKKILLKKVDNDQDCSLIETLFAPSH